METILVSIIGLILVLLIIRYVLKNFRSKPSTTSSQNANNYSSSNEGENAKAQLTMQEKLELSWQFLYKITDIVLKTFSKEDQQELHDAAKILVENGMTYEHVIDYAITKKDYKALAEEKKKTVLQR